MRAAMAAWGMALLLTATVACCDAVEHGYLSTQYATVAWDFALPVGTATAPVVSADGIVVWVHARARRGAAVALIATASLLCADAATFAPTRCT